MIKRRVLILDFVNQKKDVASDFLTPTIPDSFVKPLEETGSFDILDPQKGRKLAQDLQISAAKLYEIETAVGLGKKAEADIVLIGNFLTIQGVAQVQAQAIDVQSQRVKVTENIVMQVTSLKLFEGINMLSNKMSMKMKTALPPLPREEIIRYQKTNELHVGVYGFYSAPLQGQFSEIYKGAFGIYGQIGYSAFQSGRFHFSPVIAGSYVKYQNKAGIFPGLRIQPVSILGGVDFGYSAFRTFTIHFSALVGAAISELQRDFDNAILQSRDIELRANLELRYILWRTLSLSVMGSYSHILFQGADLNTLQVLMGMGYGF